MKKYIKPFIEIETIDTTNNIAALSNATNDAKVFDEKDAYTWEEFWKQ